jgi:anti-anti-sigma factor
VELSVTSRQEGARTVIDVGGEIDVYTAPSLRERLNELVAAGHYDLVVDMEKVEFLDSTVSGCSSVGSSECGPTTGRSASCARRRRSSRSSGSRA